MNGNDMQVWTDNSSGRFYSGEFKLERELGTRVIGQKLERVMGR